MPVRATVLLPTTKDRGLLLPYSVGSILAQTLQDFEIFIIGDGVYEETREAIKSLMQKDSRIRFFDHPKHARRGEEYRHQALQEAQGDFIAYITDRDLFLPDHLETLSAYFSKGNMVSSLQFNVLEDQVSYGLKKPDFGALHGTVMSTIAHTRALYQALPYGWRTTPAKYPTDWYMWQQILSHPNCKVFSGFRTTVLYFRRGAHPGLPTPERCKELAKWYQIVYEDQNFESYKEAAIEELAQHRQYLFFQKILVKGEPLHQVPARLYRKFTKFLKK